MRFMYRDRATPPKLAASAGIVGMLMLVACSVGESGAVEARKERQGIAAVASVVDSSMSIDEGLRRFREGLPVVAELEGGEQSREALVGRFVRALERSDTANFRTMAITRAEYAYLYYPTSPYTRPPTLQVAGLAWFFNIQASQKGLTRVMRRYGGKRLDFDRHVCADPPVLEGPNTLWSACAMPMAGVSANADLRLFGTIIERNGRFKFLSYSNDF